jgi:hypothetical protein
MIHSNISNIFSFLKTCDLHLVCELLYDKEFVNTNLRDKLIEIDYNHYNDIHLFYETDFEHVIIARISKTVVYRIKTINKRIKDIDLELNTNAFLRKIYVNEILN